MVFPPVYSFSFSGFSPAERGPFSPNLRRLSKRRVTRILSVIIEALRYSILAAAASLVAFFWPEPSPSPPFFSPTSNLTTSPGPYPKPPPGQWRCINEYVRLLVTPRIPFASPHTVVTWALRTFENRIFSFFPLDVVLGTSGLAEFFLP